MIAFYAHSSQTLINAAVIKQTYFSEETVDLIIRTNNSNLSHELVREYKNSGIFRVIYPIPFPFHLRPENGKYGKIPGLRKVTFYWEHNRYNVMILEKTVQQQRYDQLFVPSYIGNNIQYVALYLSKQNPDIQLIFYDEGLTSYTRPISSF